MKTFKASFFVLSFCLIWAAGAFCQADGLEEQGLEVGGATQAHFRVDIEWYQNQMGRGGVLLIPDSTTDTVGVFDTYDGTYKGDIITDNPGFSTPINAVMADNGDIYVSDQVADSIFVFDSNGNYLYTYADATDGLNNIRGMDFRGGHVFVTSGDDYVAEFDGPHSRLPDFIPVSEGVDSFDILFLADGSCLIADIQGSLDNIRYYDAAGVFQYELFKVDFPEQVSFDLTAPGEYLTAVFTGDSLTDFDLAGTIYDSTFFNSARGVYRLGNGNYLATAGDGVWEVEPVTGTLIENKFVGSSRFIEPADVVLQPKVDIKCNGQDGPVVIPEGGSAVLTIDVEANDSAGTDMDVWVLFTSVDTGKRWSYNKAASRWYRGWCFEYVTGPLDDHSETVLDMPLPMGAYKAYLGLDTDANGMLNIGSVLVYDMVDIDVIQVAGFTEDFDDGVADNWVDDGAHWFVLNGVYNLDTTVYDYYYSYYNFPAYSDFTYSADILQVDTGDYYLTYDFGIRFRDDMTEDNYYELRVEADGSTWLYKRVGGTQTTLANVEGPASFLTGVAVWNNFKVVCAGSTIDVYFNDVLEPGLSVVDADLTTGAVGLFGQCSGIKLQAYMYDNVVLSIP